MYNRPQSSVTAPNKGRPQTANSNNPARPITAQQLQFTGVIDDEAKRRKDLLREDILKKKNKEKFEDRLISIAVNKIQNEKAYEYLIKMGEANEICQKLTKSEVYKNRTYRVFNSADGSIKCHIYINDQFLASMTLDEFERDFKMLQAEYNKECKLPAYEVLNNMAKNKKNKLNQISNTNITEEKKGQKKEEMTKQVRQDILKECLRDTMNLTKTLKKQLEILKKRGINNRIMIPVQKK